jgi:hypothetical protein
MEQDSYLKIVVIRVLSAMSVAVFVSFHWYGLASFAALIAILGHLGDLKRET